MRDLQFPAAQVGLALGAVLVLIFAGVAREQVIVQTAPAAQPPAWQDRGASAAWLASHRPGTVSFAVVDADGEQVAGHRTDNRVSAASTIKAMILAAYLRQDDAAERPLTPRERESLQDMITWSSNDDATRLLRAAGWPALEALAVDAGMARGFFPDYESWGLTEITAASMARLFHVLPSLIPDRHRAFALGLFADVVPEQQWGMPEVTPAGWSWHVKGGWISRVVNQIGTFTKDGQQFTVAVTIEGEPGTGAGVAADPEAVPAVETIELVAEALFRDGRLPPGSVRAAPACGETALVDQRTAVPPTWTALACVERDAIAS